MASRSSSTRHMPYVEGFGTYPFGEEWLFDAVIRSYVPVCELAERLTMTVTPVLADQLEADGRRRAPARVPAAAFGSSRARPTSPTSSRALARACEAEARALPRGARARSRRSTATCCGCSRRRRASGRVELLASAATHAVLPLLATLAGPRLQIDAGLRSHRRRFGEPAGLLAARVRLRARPRARCSPSAGSSYFCTDQSAHEEPLAALAPVATAAGPVAFTIDWEAVAVALVARRLPLRPRLRRLPPQVAARRAALGDRRRPLRPRGGRRRGRASRRREFARRRGRAAASASRPSAGGRGLLVFAIDTELLGHWWWEGPGVARARCSRRARSTGSSWSRWREARERHEPEARPLRRSTWGEGKDLRTWDSPAVADLAWAARRLELRVLRGARRAGSPEAAAERAARELLAVQASDWAFLDRRRQAGDYPWQRSHRPRPAPCSRP